MFCSVNRFGSEAKNAWRRMKCNESSTFYSILFSLHFNHSHLSFLFTKIKANGISFQLKAGGPFHTGCFRQPVGMLNSRLAWKMLPACTSDSFISILLLLLSNIYVSPFHSHPHHFWFGHIVMRPNFTCYARDYVTDLISSYLCVYANWPNV